MDTKENYAKGGLLRPYNLARIGENRCEKLLICVIFVIFFKTDSYMKALPYIRAHIRICIVRSPRSYKQIYIDALVLFTICHFMDFPHDTKSLDDLHHSTHMMPQSQKFYPERGFYQVFSPVRSLYSTVLKPTLESLALKV